MTVSQKTAHLRHVRLEAAPGPKETSGAEAYDFVAPLDEQGFIDVEAWKEERALCFVHRIEDGDVMRGHLVHLPGGAGGATWAFVYDPASGDEETGFRFDAHAFAPGAYVSVATRMARRIHIASSR
jgi:hypothetical protein